MKKDRPRTRKTGKRKRDVMGYKAALRIHLHAGGAKPDPAYYGLSPDDGSIYEESVRNED